VRGFDTADLDRDGDLDAAIVAVDGVTVVVNRGGDAHHWLDVDLEAQQIKGADFAPSGRVNAHGLGGPLDEIPTASSRALAPGYSLRD
jgi:hypothetical protein